MGARRLRLCVASALSLAGCAGAGTVAPPLGQATQQGDDPPSAQAPRFTPRISKVAAHGELLWVRGSDGSLAAFDPHRSAFSRHLVSERVVDVHQTADGRLWALSVDPTTDDARLWERRERAWDPVLEIAAPLDLLAVSDRRGKPVLFSQHAVFVSDADGAFSGRSLDHAIEPGLVQQIHFAVTEGDLAYAGTNSSELGGALYRIELATGHVELLRSAGTGLCEGVSNLDCDPVTSVIVDPERPRCVLAGVGRVHFRPSGRLLRVCDREVSVAWRSTGASQREGDANVVIRPLIDDLAQPAVCLIDPEACPPWWSGGICVIDPASCPSEAEDGRRDAEEAVLGLARAHDGFWMVTDAGLYLSRSGRVDRFEHPAYERRGALTLGALPGAWAVITDLSWAALSSGYTPLVAADRSARSAAATPGPAEEPVSPVGRCWHRPAREASEGSDLVLCIEADRYFAKTPLGITSALWSSTQAAGVWSMELADGQTIELEVRRDRIRVSRVEKDSLVQGTLTELRGAELSSVRGEVAELATVERVCDQARSCDRARSRVIDALESGYDGRSKSLPEVRTLRTCWDFLDRTAAELSPERVPECRLPAR